MLYYAKTNLKSGLPTFFLLCIIFVFLFPCSAYSNGKLYFLSLVEKDDYDQSRIILEWGSLEGNIFEDIQQFKLYRSENSGSGYGDYAELPLPFPAFLPDQSPIGNESQCEQNLKERIAESTTEKRFNNLLQILINWGYDANIQNFYKFLFPVLNPEDKDDYNALKKMLLLRRFPGIAVASSLGYVDKNVKLQNRYKYLLSIIKKNTQKILPAGKTPEIDPSQMTALPEPTNFRQVLVSQNSIDCSEYDKNLDDRLIHMTWDIPSSPSELSLQVMTYGYDIFWAAKDDTGVIGDIEARDTAAIETHINAGRLHRLNEDPIFISGPASSEGRESYLVKDNGSEHAGWARGDEFMYYLAAIDIAGHYSKGNLVKIEGLDSESYAMVQDMQAPPIPWRIRTVEEKNNFDPENPAPPDFFLEWETMTKKSWLRNYGEGKNICHGDDTKVCYSMGNQACKGNERDVCVDLDIKKYRVFKFDTPEKATEWGADFDGDGWPDSIEQDKGFNPCNKESKPPGELPIAGTIPHDPDKKATRFKIQETLVYDKVYWYRVAAIDQNDNIGNLSPPVRVVLHDRTQPENTSNLFKEKCNFSAEWSGSCGQPGDDAILTIKVDISAENTVEYIGIYSYYYDIKDQVYRYRFHGKKKITGSEIEITSTFFNSCDPNGCEGNPGDCDYVVRFFDHNDKLITESDLFDLSQDCNIYNGCITLTKDIETCSLYPYDGQDDDSDDTFYFCPNFSEELGKLETARLYLRINGKMSPFFSIENTTDCKAIPGLNWIVPDNACLGSRIFSKNHVGSEMKFFDCFPRKQITSDDTSGWINPEPFPAPIIDDIETGEDDQGKYFTIFWTCQTDGIAAFPVRMKNSENQFYETSFNLEQDGKGRFFHKIYLRDDNDLNKKWYFSVRAVDLTMKASDWSKQKSGTWDDIQILQNQNQKTKILPWPNIDLPENVDRLKTAFIIRDHSSDSPLAYIPAIVLSDDLSNLSIGNKIYRCAQTISKLLIDLECNGVERCIMDKETEFELCNFCPLLQGLLSMDSFIVYRQEEGKDYVQVSPLLEKLHCYSEDNDYFMHDPYIFLRNFQSAAITGIGNIDENLITGLRLVFVDRYPRTELVRVRYKILDVNHSTGEIDRIYTTNWIQ
ncbi:MAG: hypothetical protein K8S13_22255 [Desulfobacula sp.]|uniref:hypothetical protein n=1 Tax=Desulfobacula sp. TaxID=2593537 RepID=UPI0025C24794|nr:hypothetical protein [Desulfobacula sp.]MCD4722553.1 hypothetical protein [Desulfobacula sp.]